MRHLDEKLPVSWQLRAMGTGRIGITALLEKVCERNNIFHRLNANFETRGNIPDEVSELSVPGTHFDRQSYTHHLAILKSIQIDLNS